MSNTDYEKKWLKGELDEKEMKAFQNTEEYAFLDRLQGALKHFEAPQFDMSAQEKRLEEKFQAKSVKTIDWTGSLLKIAASILVLIVSVYVIYQLNDQPGETSLTGHAAEESSLYLPDSSLVSLNIESALSYDWTQSRRVELSGEAFFSVKKGSRFDVVTEMGTVSVVGTEFNVEVWEDFLEVVCFEGSVKVTTDQEVILLEKEESWRLIDGQTRLLTDEIGVSPDWRNDESRFRSMPLKYVLKELERQYDVNIIYENIDQEQQFTGAFPHDNINLALKSISIPLNLTYKLEEKQIKIIRDQ